MKTLITSLFLFASAVLFSLPAFAANTLVGLTTSGVVYQIDTTTGALTQIVDSPITNFELGATARKGNVLYYVAAPSGTSENAIYSVNTTTGLAIFYDLDRNDDHVTALFFGSGKLHGIFYNPNTGAAGVYRINPITGVTTLVVDLTALAAEPVGGAISRIGDFYYTLAKPTTDTRQLIRFKLKAGSAKAKNILSSTGTSILCDRIKPNFKNGKFVCLASPSSTQVDVCRLGLSGVAQCVGTLTNTERLASGHTLMHSGNSFFALVYAPGEPNNQHLLKFTPAGVTKASPTIASGALFVGARFGKEEDVIPAG